jgi:fumarate reductase subunit C
MIMDFLANPVVIAVEIAIVAAFFLSWMVKKQQKPKK